MSRCDSHVHVVGPIERYPQLPNRSGIMAPAEVPALRQLGAAHGITRFVIVQPSFYGTDNSMLLDALDALGGHGRGVAVIDNNGIAQNVLEGWGRRGVCGLRINIYSPIGPPKELAETFNAMARIAQPLGWHVEVIASLPEIARHADLFGSAKVPVVLDHYGVYGAARPNSSKDAQRMLDLLRAPHVWMKLSAPYRVSDNPLQTKPDKEWLAAMLDAGEERCVWGSDWPHTPPHENTEPAYRPIAYAALVNDFVAALGDAALAERIMRDNPARLYGFS
jgi:predicted TIM-barrel fold metal-dependent hydrolase